MTKNKKVDLDKLVKETYTGTQVGFLIENFDYKLGVTIEAFDHKLDVITEKIDKIESKLDATFEAVGDIKVDLTVMKDKEKELNRRVIVLEKRAVI